MSHWFCLIFSENRQSSGQMPDREMINDELKNVCYQHSNTKAQTVRIYFLFSVDLSKIHFLFQSEQNESMHLVIKLFCSLKICPKRNTQALNSYEHVAFAFK